MEFKFGDFGGTPAMFVQAVSRQEPFSGKESLRCTRLGWIFLLADGECFDFAECWLFSLQKKLNAKSY